MANFLDLFPKTAYNIDRSRNFNYQQVTNITFRVGIVKSILKNISSYYEYEVREGETPEILAERVYRNPYAYWIILYANDMFDPNYDWPMNNFIFKKYIINKYGSFEWAKTNIHHYEKVIERRENITGEINEKRYIVGEQNLLAQTNIDIPSESFWSDIADEGDWETFTINGKTFSQRTYRNEVSYFDYEENLNNERRLIKIIKEEYYPVIMDEFRDLVDYQDPMVRRLI
jgi:hypothetical protein